MNNQHNPDNLNNQHNPDNLDHSNKERIEQDAAEDMLAALEERLGVRFRDRTILVRALTHHSMCPETTQRDSYDTLEFFGDAIIGVQVVEYLFHTYPDANEGEMTALKSEVVSRRVLARVGARLDRKSTRLNSSHVKI